MTQMMAKDGADELVVNSGVMKLKDLGKDLAGKGVSDGSGKSD
jgi:hypothetical protein